MSVTLECEGGTSQGASQGSPDIQLYNLVEKEAKTQAMADQSIADEESEQGMGIFNCGHVTAARL